MSTRACIVDRVQYVNAGDAQTHRAPRSSSTGGPCPTHCMPGPLPRPPRAAVTSTQTHTRARLQSQRAHTARFSGAHQPMCASLLQRQMQMTCAEQTTLSPGLRTAPTPRPAPSPMAGAPVALSTEKARTPLNPRVARHASSCRTRALRRAKNMLAPRQDFVACPVSLFF